MTQLENGGSQSRRSRRLVLAMVSTSVLAVISWLLVDGVPLVARERAGDPPADTVMIARVVASVRGASPVLCTLVSHGLDNRWGGRAVRPLDGIASDAASEEMFRWLNAGDMSARAVPALRRALQDGDECVRRTAARLFDRVEEGAGVAAQITPLLNDNSLAVRTAAIWALGYADDTTAVRALTPLLRDADASIRRAAAAALGDLEAAGAAAALTESLRDGDAGVRYNSAWALGRIESGTVVPALADALAKDSDARVRRAAAWALGQLKYDATDALR